MFSKPAVGGDAIPMTIYHLGKLLIGLEPLPLEACPPVLEEVPRPGNWGGSHAEALK